MAIVKVYGAAMSTCTARVIATLQEKGVVYELIPVDFATAEHKQPSHLSKNPFGKVPAFEDGDLVLFESRAISRYVARKYTGSGTDLLRTDSVEESANVDVWMEVEGQTYNPAISAIVYNCLVAPAMGRTADAKLLESSAETLEKVLDVYEARLGWTEYLAGDFFSLADLHHLPYTHYFMKTPYAPLIESRPNVKAWWGRVSSRPACKKVTAAMMFSK